MNEWPTALRVNAFIRAVEQAGGQAMVLARGDRDSGIVLLLTLENRVPRLFERGFLPDGRRGIIGIGGQIEDEAQATSYWQRRRNADPDLWVVEAIVARAERLGAETLWAD